MEVLFVLGVVLLIIMVVGHLMWEAVAFALRGFRGREAGKPKMLCPRCATMVSVFPCRACGFVQGRRDDLTVAREVLQRLANEGLLDGETHHRVRTAIDEAAVPTARRRPAEAAPAPVKVAQAAAAPPPVTPTAPPPPPPVPTPADEEEWEEVHTEEIPLATARPVPPAIPRRPVMSPPARPVPPAPPPPPRKPFSVVLRSFLEEKNIRWGELIGGLLIVGCSLALVLSLWAEISERPFLKVGVFTAIVAGLFGLGLYAQRKWKLPTTSRGILTTAMLMLPLHFAAMVVIGGQEQSDVVVMLVQAASALALGALAWLAAEVIAPRTRMLTTGGVLACALAGPLLYMTGQLQRSLGGSALLMGALSVLLGALAVATIWRVAKHGTDLARESIVTLGVLLFASVPSFVIHAYLGGATAGYWPMMAPILAMLTLPMLAGVSLLRQRVEERSWRMPLWVTEVALIGLPLFWVGVALPLPIAVLEVAGISAAAVILIACINRERYHFAAGGVLLLISYAAALPVLMGRLAWWEGDLLQALWVPQLGVEFAPAIAVLGVLGALVMQRDRVGGLLIAGVGAAASALGLVHLLATVYVAGHAVAGASAVLAIYGVLAIVGAMVTRLRPVAIVGTALLLLAGHQWYGADARGLMFAALVLATGWAVAGIAMKGAKVEQLGAMARDNLAWTGVVATLAVLWQVKQLPVQSCAGYSAWAAGTLLAMYVLYRGAVELAMAQAALSVAAVFTAAWLAGTERAEAVILAGAAALVLLQGVWLALKRVPALKLPETRTLTVDQVLGYAGAVVIGGMTVILLQEHALRELYTRHLASGYALLPGEALLWIALGLMVGMGIMQAWAGHARAGALQGVIGIYLAAGVGALCLWPGMGASGMRYAACAVMLGLAGAGWAGGFRGRLSDPVRGTILLIGGGAVALLTWLAAAAQFSGSGPVHPLGIFAQMGAAASYLLPLAALAGVLVVEAVRTRSTTFASLACLTVHFAATLAYVLQEGLAEGHNQIRLLELNAIVAGACAWIWLLVRQVMRRDEEDVPGMVHILAGLVGLVAIGLALVIQSTLLDMTFLGTAFSERFGGYIGWIIALLAVSLWWRLWRTHMPAFGVFATIVICFSMAATLVPLLPIDPYFAHRTVLLGHVAGVWVLYFGIATLADWGLLGRSVSGHGGTHAADEQRDADGRVQLAYALQHSEEQSGLAADWRARLMVRARVWGILLAIAAVIHAGSIELSGDPLNPWLWVGTFAALCALGVVVAQRELRPGYLYPTTVCACLAVSRLWAEFTPSHAGHALLLVNTAVVAAMGLVSVLLEVQRFEPVFGPSRTRLHVPAAWLTVGVLLPLGVISSAMTDLSWASSRELMALSLSAAGTTVALAASCLWIRSMTGSTLLLYLSSFTGLAMALDLGGFKDEQVLQVWMIAGVGLCTLWGALLRRWHELRAWVERFGAVLPLPSFLPQLNVTVAAVCMAAMMVHEGMLAAEHGSAPMAPWLIVVFAGMLVLLMVSLIMTALDKIRDPLLLPFPDRESYVYSAEIVALLLFVHIRLTCPQFFSGFITQYWPLVALAIAFGCLAVGHLLAKRGVKVIAGPLLNSSLVIALVPSLLAQSAGSRLQYELVLLTGCAFYTATALIRRSAVAAVLAAMALNGAIWGVLWDAPALSFARHPQLWLIPPALSVIVASYFLRSRFSASQLAAIRYGALVVIYLASTMDMFLVGVAQNPWLIGVLGLLSVIGALAGILLRIRSMLYMGVGFLVVSIITFIYHATANLHQIWLMWLLGIALGVGILLMFALFEKRKEQLERALTQLQGWEQ